MRNRNATSLTRLHSASKTCEPQTELSCEHSVDIQSRERAVGGRRELFPVFDPQSRPSNVEAF